MVFQRDLIFNSSVHSLLARYLINEGETRKVIGDIVKGVAHLVALNTPGGEFVLITSGTVNLLFARDKALRANGILANHTAEALLVPLSGLIFHLLSA